MKLSYCVNKLINRHGGLRICARAHDVDAAYLSRLWTGKKTNPSPVILKKLGIHKSVEYHFY